MTCLRRASLLLVCVFGVVLMLLYIVCSNQDSCAATWDSPTTGVVTTVLAAAAAATAANPVATAATTAATTASATSLPTTPPTNLATTTPATEDLLALSLQRPLCIVLVMGNQTHVGVKSAVQRLARHQRNCLFHIADVDPRHSDDVNVATSPPTFVFDMFDLVSNGQDVVAQIAKLESAEPYARRNSSNLSFRTISAATAAALPLFPLRATVYVEAFELNRVAMAIVRPSDETRTAAFIDVLQRFLPAKPPGFLEAVMLQQCAESDRAHINKISQTLLSFGYSPSQPAADGSTGIHHAMIFDQTDDAACQHQLFLRHPIVPDAYPKEPLAFLRIKPGGRTTNILVEENNVLMTIAMARAAEPWSSAGLRTYVLSERLFGERAGHWLYNMSTVARALGVPNRAISPVDLVSVQSLGWCTGACFHVETAHNCSDHGATNNCEAPGCVRSLPTAFQARLRNQSASLSTEFCTHHQQFRKLSSANKEMGILMDGGLFFPRQGPKTWKSDPTKDFWPSADGLLPTNAWLDFGPVVHELARMQLDIYKQRLRTYWHLPADAPVRIVGYHMRLTDLGFASDVADWINVTEHALAAMGRLGSSTPLFHGAIICSDSFASSEFLAVIKTLPADTPTLDCASFIAQWSRQAGPRSLLPVALEIAVIQTMLARVTCFLGLDVSSFSWRIRFRRTIDGFSNADCDRVIFHPDRHS